MMRGRIPEAMLLALGCLAGCDREAPEVVPPPPDVKVAAVLQRDVPVYVEAIGEVRGNTEIEIRARVEGFIESVDYKEGSIVTKGQLLYTIDPRPFQANLTESRARQAEAEAELARAHQDVVRYEPLVAKNAISREMYETAVAVEKSAAAALEAARAMVEQAEIDLSYTKVTAPEEGLAGRTEVYAGTLVGRGQSTLLTRISRIDPIHVRFTFPEKDYLAYARKRGAGVRADPAPDTAFELVMTDGSVHPAPGSLVFVDRNVDARTGTIMAEAAFANPGEILRPGQYARVRATVEERSGAILVPQRAVAELQGVFSVMALAEGDTVEQRLVTPAERIGSLWVILSGLKAGDRVVVEGLQKVRPGMQVNAQTVLIEEEGEKEGGTEAQAGEGQGGDAAPAGEEKAE
ncbi:MAG: efflux RND transporter periplasmic adaptor subunit [Planctomycetota bacterium]|nr:MAG: efflux RND transporter periplasmic adaptor subunit [Planctomycetota bacterium]